MTIDFDMKASLTAALKTQEGFRSEPYKCTAGYLTIGYGRNLETVGISQDEAEHLLENDIVKAYNQVVSSMPWVHDIPKPAQLALTNMCFQLGYGGLSKFKKMLAAVQEHEWDVAISEAYDSQWRKQTPARYRWVADRFEACK